MQSRRVLIYEVHCTGCGYDLRGLLYDGSCPECGMRVQDVLVDIAGRVKRANTYALKDLRNGKIADVALHSRYTLEEAMFLYEVLVFAIEGRRHRGTKPLTIGKERVTAHELCQAVRDYADIHFGATAAQRLTDWGMATRHQVAALVTLLIKHNAIQTSKDDNMADFNAPDCPDPVEQVAG